MWKAVTLLSPKGQQQSDQGKLKQKSLNKTPNNSDSNNRNNRSAKNKPLANSQYTLTIDVMIKDAHVSNSAEEHCHESYN